MKALRALPPARRFERARGLSSCRPDAAPAPGLQPPRSLPSTAILHAVLLAIHVAHELPHEFLPALAVLVALAPAVGLLRARGLVFVRGVGPIHGRSLLLDPAAAVRPLLPCPAGAWLRLLFFLVLAIELLRLV